MVANNYRSMSGMFFYPIRIDRLLCSIKLLFCNVFIGFFVIIDQLFLGSINTLDLTK